jgi:hypothetical protein
MPGNKHVVVAMIVAPMLSILAWLAVGELTGEEPQLARPGQSYPLLEKSNCRYASGVCDLENGDLTLRLSSPGDALIRLLELRSSHPLDGVVVSIGDPAVEVSPVPMTAVSKEGLLWTIAFDTGIERHWRIRLVASSAGAAYFGDAGSAFLLPDTVSH